MAKHLILFCSHFREEVEKLNISETHKDVAVSFYPGRCGHPPLQWETIKDAMGDQTDCSSIDVVSGGCIIGLQKASAEAKNVKIHRMEQCFHMIASPDTVDQYIEKGYYLVTPGWLAHWRSFMELWGFEREMAQNYFSESATGVLLLNTGTDGKAYGNLQEFSSFIDRPYEVMSVGLGHFELMVTNIILRRQLETGRDEAKGILDERQKELARYAMALDLLRVLAKVRREEEVIKQIVEMFTMLFAPENVSYRPADSPEPADDYAVPLTERGFTLPIAVSGRTLGILEVKGLRFPEYREHYLNLASGMADVCGLAIENARHYEELKGLSDTDGLTGVANRRRFDEHLDDEWKRMTREQKPMSIVMCDVDFFKRYNDSYGHQAGDDCLRSVARVLSFHCKRPADIAARYGGEEFAIILSDTGTEGACYLAEKIRQAVEDLHIPHDDSAVSHFVTISMGVSGIVPSSRIGAQDLLLSADKSLYEAKAQGRNRVMVAAV